MVVPRGGAWGERVAADARARGLSPVVVPLIADAAPDDPAALDAAVARLVASGPAWRHGSAGPAGSGPSATGQDTPPEDRRPGESGRVAAPSGPDPARSVDAARRAVGRVTETAVTAGPGYTWLIVTSATAVRVLAERVAGLPSGLRIAAVGEATARAARAAGWVVDLVPDDASAAALAAALPDTDGTVLVPRSDLAAPTLVDGLRSRGIDVDDVVAYRTVGTGDEPITLDPPPDAVLVTSGSVAHQVARRMAPLDPRTVIVCIGPGTASEAREAGLPVHVVAQTRSAQALLDAVVGALRPTAPRQGPTAPRQEGTP